MGDDAFIVGVGVLRFLSFCLAASLAAAIVGDIVTAAHPTIPVMAECGQLLLDDFAADRALVLGRTVVGAGRVHPRILDLRIVVFMGVSLEIGCQHDAARIGVLGHREADRRAAVAAAGAGRPARKDKALVRHCSHSCRRAALFDELARRAGQLAAVCSNKFQRDLRAAHGDGILVDKVRGHTVRRRDRAQRLRAAVLGGISMGAHVGKIRGNGLLREVHAVGQRVVLFGPACGIVAQDLGAVQKLKAVFLAHLHERGVVGIDLGHRQVRVLALFVQRGNGADDDVTVGPRGLDGLQSLQIGLYVVRRVRRRAGQVVGAVADDDALGLEHGHSVRYGVHRGRALELFAFQGCDRPHAHADNTDVVVQTCECRAGLVGVQQVACRV